MVFHILSSYDLVWVRRSSWPCVVKGNCWHWFSFDLVFNQLIEDCRESDCGYNAAKSGKDAQSTLVLLPKLATTQNPQQLWNTLTSALAFLLTVEMYFVHFHIIHRCHNPQEKLVKINTSTYSLSIHIHYLAISKKAILRQTLFFLFASYIWSLKKTKHDMKEKCYESKS